MTRKKEPSIVTIDCLNSGVPEDGFGLTNGGYFFVAISKGGFRDDRKSIIFIFEENRVVTKTDFVTIKTIYKCNLFSEILKEADIYDDLIINHLFDVYSKINGVKRKSNLVYENKHVNSILTSVLKYLYNRLALYFNCNRMNIKKKNFRFLFEQLEKSNIVIGNKKPADAGFSLFKIMTYYF